jgi:hypothetical protein
MGKSFIGSYCNLQEFASHWILDALVSGGWEYFDDGISPALFSFWTCFVEDDIDGPVVEEAKQVRNTQI